MGESNSITHPPTWAQRGPAVIPFQVKVKVTNQSLLHSSPKIPVDPVLTMSKGGWGGEGMRLDGSYMFPLKTPRLS